MLAGACRLGGGALASCERGCLRSADADFAVSPLREAALRGENAALHARGDALEAQLGDSWRQLSESRVSSRQEAAALEERVGRLAAEVRQATQTQRLLEQANVQLATELRHRGPLNGALKGAAVSASTSPQPPRSGPPTA